MWASIIGGIFLFIGLMSFATGSNGLFCLIVGAVFIGLYLLIKKEKKLVAEKKEEELVEKIKDAVNKSNSESASDMHDESGGAK